MNRFINFVIKEFYHIFRDVRTLLVIFGMPVAQLLIFGYAIRTEINDAELGVLDYSKDYVTQEITNKIISSGYFKLNGYLNNSDEIETYFKSGKVKQVICFEQNFAEKLKKEGRANVQLINDASNPNFATLVNSYSTAILLDYQQSLIKKMNISPATIGIEVKMLFNPEIKSVFMFVPGLIALILMLLSAMMTSVAITREKEMGNMEILLCSPLKPPVIIIGKVIPYTGLAFINGISILIMANLIFGLPVKGSIILFLLETVLYITTSLSIGIFISTLANTQKIAMMISLVGLLMPTMLLSGFIYPVENMPIFLQYISKAMPASWFLIIIKGIMLKGVGIEYLWKETLVLAGMSLFFILLSIKKFKTRLE